MLCKGTFAGKVLPHFQRKHPSSIVDAQLEAVEARGDGWWVVFGDSVLALSCQLHCMARETPAGMYFNRTMGGQSEH
jgi:hypothetical protein